MRRKIGALIIALAIFLGMSSNSAHAAAMASFPAQNTYSYSLRYTRGLQIMMYNYSVAARKAIVDSGGVDGSYGSGTVQAVLVFQRSWGLSQDGMCGPATWSALRSMLSMYYYALEGSRYGEYARYYLYSEPYPEAQCVMELEESFAYINSQILDQLWYAYHKGIRYYVG